MEVVVAELSLQLQLWFLIHSDACIDDEEGADYPARALRALGLLLADGAPTVGGNTF